MRVRVIRISQDNKLLVPSLAEMKGYKIVVATLSTARSLSLMEVPKGHFTHIFIDEAAQVCLLLSMRSDEGT